jgi:hypothetical protein
MRVPMLAGRTFGPEDVARPTLEAVVSRAFAERYWKGGSALGKRLRPSIGGAWYTVVGVAGDVHMASLDTPAEQFVYFPMVTPGDSAEPSVVPRVVAVALRTTGDPMRLAAALRAIVKRVDPAVPTYAERPMAALLGAAAARTWFVLLMLAVASLIALVIGAVGLYGVLAYGVTLRRREIGVRIALGAAASDVSRMIARRGLALAGAGVAAGLVGALVTMRLMRGLLYGVSPTDPAALAATCAVLLAVALLASWLPARRAAAVDPIEALRRD